MPREPSGIYNLPNAPVVSNTTILSSDENTTRDDMAAEIEASLDRHGRGPMLAPVRVPNQTAGAPGYSFTDETNTGWYRAGANDVRFAVGGVDILRITAAGLSALSGSTWVPITPVLENFAQKNVIIGGNFGTNPYQRGTSFAGVLNGAFIADRFSYVKSGAAVHTAERIAGDFPTAAEAGVYASACQNMRCTTAQASMAAGDFFFVQHIVEGYNAQSIYQRPIVLSFWHKHSKVGTYSVSLRNGLRDQSYVAEYQQVVSSAWEKAVIPILATPNAAGWDTTNGSGIIVSFAIAMGTNFKTATLNSWIAGNFVASSNQVNACDSTANVNFKLALVQLEKGTIATAFEQRSFQEELELCQRYFEKSYDLSITPGTAHAAGLSSGPSAAGTAGASIIAVPYQVRKRTTPTITLYNYITGVAAGIVDGGGAAVGANILGSGEHAFTIVNTSAAVANSQVFSQWTSSAELT